MSETSGYGNNKYGTSPLGSGDPQEPTTETSEFGYGVFGYGSGPFGSTVEAASIAVEAQDSIDVTDTVDVQGVSNLKVVTVSDTASITDTVADLDILLRVSAASSTGKNTVLVTFSNDLNTSFGPLASPSNYFVNPLLVISSVQIVGPRQVLLQTITDQAFIPYTVTVVQAESLTGDSLGPVNSASFQGFSTAPTFKAGALSSTKVLLEFSSNMLVNPNLIDPSSYTVTANLGGTSVPVTAVVVSAGSRRVTLTLGTALVPRGYYAVSVGPLVLSILGVSPQPNVRNFRWNYVQPPSEIAISDFSGEVSGGILGTPEGQVFFSPALAEADDTSTIEIEEVSVCTRAYDEYKIPEIPDPDVLYTFAPGTANGLLGQVVLWAPPHRLGLAKVRMQDKQQDIVLPKIYVPSTGTMESPVADYAAGTLRETINTTRAAFLNDVRWKTYPNAGALVFRTADNGTPIGPGPTTQVQLSTVKTVQVSDSAIVSDSSSVP